MVYYIILVVEQNIYTFIFFLLCLSKFSGQCSTLCLGMEKLAEFRDCTPREKAFGKPFSLSGVPNRHSAKFPWPALFVTVATWSCHVFWFAECRVFAKCVLQVCWVSQLQHSAKMSLCSVFLSEHSAKMLALSKRAPSGSAGSRCRWNEAKL